MKSRHTIKPFVRFKGDFKKEIQREIPGRDLAEFLAERLRQKDYVVNSVEYEEPWFNVNVVSGSIEYPLMVSHSGLEENYWEVSCPRTLGFFARLRGKSEDAERQNLIKTLDEILQAEKTITDIKWYSDYSDLCDDYVQKPVARRLNVAAKYIEKLSPPICLTGWILAVIGGIRSGTESLLLRIGTIMFLLPFVLFFGFIALKSLVALIYDIKESRREKTKTKWLRWLVYILPIAAIVTPFFVGRFIPGVNKVFEEYLPPFLVLLLFCGVLFALFFGVLLDFQEHKDRTRKTLLVIGLILVLLGMTGFFAGGLSNLGVLRWVPNSVEFPLAQIAGIDVDRSGNLFVASDFYNRIQVYNPKGDFVRGWFIYSRSKRVRMRINDKNNVEVAGLQRQKIDVFDENGKLLTTKKYDDRNFFDSFEHNRKQLFDEPRRCHYDVEGLVFPGVIQTGPDGEKKIGKNAFYLFPFQGAAQAIATALVGMLLMNQADKKRKKKRR